ncbi:hypothetical protein [Hydrogenophaga sp.]|uniref:hypothetical protein n=1 Tax=Hydrogenophaga sp. TaxID=1904254 RepID=UPI00260C81E4|nr:hypothetical protein [Hydrogenophaga sp.]MDM7951550.1 hypothetical protein [Hydrogenophaga sp.]
MEYASPLSRKTNPVSLAVAAMLLATSAQAGVIADSNPTVAPTFLGSCGTSGAAEACVGAWNLDNVDVQQVRADGTTTFGSFEKSTGAYAAMASGESFISSVKDAMGSVMAKVTGKVWPVGEPSGIKAVNGDTQTKNGKPQNCLINSSYLGFDVSTSGLEPTSTAPHPSPSSAPAAFSRTSGSRLRCSLPRWKEWPTALPATSPSTWCST